MKEEKIALTEDKKKANEMTELKVLGTAHGIGDDDKTYVICTDGTKYYLFTGQLCTEPSNDFMFNYDHMWDDI